ncbi:hypothetical protein TN55_001405 [Salmonella enterica subsp. enterica]|nr:hypothetical protein [Salmonella enterica subsp. enterica]
MAKPDWEAIETAYRAGVMSLREIASHHGISEGATCRFRAICFFPTRRGTTIPTGGGLVHGTGSTGCRLRS